MSVHYWTEMTHLSLSPIAEGVTLGYARIVSATRSAEYKLQLFDFSGETDTLPRKGNYAKDKYIFITRSTFMAILEHELNRNPDLVPFSGGDRASMLGQESAEHFAKRRIESEADWLATHERFQYSNRKRKRRSE